MVHLQDSRFPSSNCGASPAATTVGSCAGSASPPSTTGSLISSTLSVFANEGYSSSSTEHLWKSTPFDNQGLPNETNWFFRGSLVILRRPYLHVGEIHVVVGEEAEEFLEVLLCREVMPTVRPYSLEKKKKKKKGLTFSSCPPPILEQAREWRGEMSERIRTFRTPSVATNLPAAVVAPPARKLEC